MSAVDLLCCGYFSSHSLAMCFISQHVTTLHRTRLEVKAVSSIAPVTLRVGPSRMRRGSENSSSGHRRRLSSSFLKEKHLKASSTCRACHSFWACDSGLAR